MDICPKGDKGLHSALASLLKHPHFCKMRRLFCALLILAAWARGENPAQSSSPETSTASPWAEKAVWYQIFPERFHNGDPQNDPTPEYCRVPEKVRSRWGVIPWTKE